MKAGLMAEFESAEGLTKAAHELRKKGYKDIDAFTPYPLLPVERAIGLRRSRIGWAVFPIAMAGAVAAYLIQWATNAIDYPLNVGGRPPHAAPAFILITFEMGVLFAGLSAFLILFGIARLPALYNPVFDVPNFDRATVDRFFLAVGHEDPAFNRERTARDLVEVGAVAVSRFGRKEDH